jgi:hypothetical protein
MRCLDIIFLRKGQVMTDLSDWEEKAIDHASDMAGEYLESLGKTDLATMTHEEWRALIAGVYLNATGKIQEFSASGDVPF